MNKVIVISLFLLSHSVYYSYNLLVARYGDKRLLLGFQFNSFWTFTLFTLLLATPVLTLANYSFASAFYLGYREEGAVWSTIIYFILAQLLAISALTFIILRETPSKGAFLGIAMALSGLVVSNIWK